MKFDLKKDLKRLLVVCLASVLMALNIKSFVRTGGLYPGGATGLSLLIQRGAQMYLGLALPYTVINVILNAIPIYIGFRFIGKKFTLYSCLCIVLTSVLTDLIPGIAITSDVLLISIFGGIINGFAISLCLLTGSTTGGTDFISIYLSEKKGMDAFNIILGLNAVILVAAGFMFGWDKALTPSFSSLHLHRCCTLCTKNTSRRHFSLSPIMENRYIRLSQKLPITVPPFWMAKDLMSIQNDR